MPSCRRRMRTEWLWLRKVSPLLYLLACKPGPSLLPWSAVVSRINGLHDASESVSVSLVAVGPPPSPSATISLVSLLPPALDAAPHGGQQAGLRGVEGQRLHHAGTHRKGQCQGTLHQVPEVHLPVLGAADHVCVTLAQAAVQLVLLVLMACVPGVRGGVRRAWVLAGGWGELHDPEDSLAQQLPCVLV